MWEARREFGDIVVLHSKFATQNTEAGHSKRYNEFQTLPGTSFTGTEDLSLRLLGSTWQSIAKI